MKYRGALTGGRHDRGDPQIGRSEADAESRASGNRIDGAKRMSATSNLFLLAVIITAMPAGAQLSVSRTFVPGYGEKVTIDASYVSVWGCEQNVCTVGTNQVWFDKTECNRSVATVHPNYGPARVFIFTLKAYDPPLQKDDANVCVHPPHPQPYTETTAQVVVKQPGLYDPVRAQIRDSANKRRYFSIRQKVAVLGVRG